ncbi:MAG: beta-ketoacyl synthase N-terminal-like domain-containing protein [Myxococcota bacterium]
MNAASPVITAWSAVSAFGVGRRAFSEGIREGRLALSSLDRATWSVGGEACLVPNFDPAQLLGRKGTRAMDRATALAVVTVGQLVANDADGLKPSVGSDTAIVLGTSTGSASSIMSFTRDSLTQDRPYLVDPAKFPNTVMNCAAGRSAIWHGLRGPNVTIAGGSASTLLVLNYARRLQRSGRAHSIVCGAVEEFSRERWWLEWHTREPEQRFHWLGEGCAALLLEATPRDGRTALAELAAVEVGLPLGESDVGKTLVSCLQRALTQAGVTPNDVWAYATSATGALAEREAIEQVLDGSEARELPCASLLGDTNAASMSLQIAAVLAAAEHAPEAKGRAALVTGIERDGMVGCAVLRLLSGAAA